MRVAFLTLLIVTLSFQQVAARFVVTKNYAELMSESDLIVIVHSRGTRPANDGDKVVPIDRDVDYLSPVITQFDVLAVVKGNYSEKVLELSHYKYDFKPGSSGVINGPCLVWFPMREDDLIQGKSWIARVPNDFMLFLKRDDKGRLTFLTGQFDAEPSVRQIHDPLPPSMTPDP